MAAQREEASDREARGVAAAARNHLRNLHLLHTHLGQPLECRGVLQSRFAGIVENLVVTATVSARDGGRAGQHRRRLLEVVFAGRVGAGLERLLERPMIQVIPLAAYVICHWREERHGGVAVHGRQTTHVIRQHQHMLVAQCSKK